LARCQRQLLKQLQLGLGEQLLPLGVQTGAAPAENLVAQESVRADVLSIAGIILAVVGARGFG